MSRLHPDSSGPLDPILEVKEISHILGKKGQGIMDISFSVCRGEFILLAGKNGCGKTTLIRHLNGLLRPDTGRINLHGKDIFSDLTAARKTVGMVFQDAETQIIGETCFDEVAFGPENLKMDRKTISQKVIKALELMDLLKLKDRNPASLSGGEKRRLTIAGILVMDPEILVLDEPFANLDYPASLSLINHICQLNLAGKTIIMATHDVDMVLASASRLMIMDSGKIAVDGPAPDMADHLPGFGIKSPCSCSARERNLP